MRYPATIRTLPSPLQAELGKMASEELKGVNVRVLLATLCEWKLKHWQGAAGNMLLRRALRAERALCSASTSSGQGVRVRALFCSVFTVGCLCPGEQRAGCLVCPDLHIPSTLSHSALTRQRGCFALSTLRPSSQRRASTSPCCSREVRV